MIRPGLIDLTRGEGPRGAALGAPLMPAQGVRRNLTVPTPGRIRRALAGRGLWNPVGPSQTRMPAPILIYHGIASDDAPTDAYTLHRATFRRHLDEIRRFGAATLRLDELLDGGSPGDAIALTFDDGCTSWKRIVAPELAARDLRATLFIIANPASRRGGSRAGGDTLSWSDLRSLLELRGRDGAPLIAIGSHTSRHVDLSAMLRRVGPHAVLDELRDSRRRIEDALGRPCRLLSLPGGRADHDDTTRRALLWVIREAGFDVIRDSTPRYDRDPAADLLGGSPVYSHTTETMIRFELSRVRRGNWLNAARWTWLRATGRWNETMHPLAAAKLPTGALELTEAAGIGH